MPGMKPDPPNTVTRPDPIGKSGAGAAGLMKLASSLLRGHLTPKPGLAKRFPAWGRMAVDKPDGAPLRNRGPRKPRWRNW